jgi:hypothetical protein
MVESTIGAERIAQRAQQMALAAGIGKIGVTWDEGQRFVHRGPHVLTIFRGVAMSTTIFSEDEVQGYPDRLHKARTEAKLDAMVRQVARRLKAPITREPQPATSPDGDER